MTNVHIVHGWVWKWGQQVGGNTNWPCLGGPSGGDDLYDRKGMSRNSEWVLFTLRKWPTSTAEPLIHLVCCVISQPAKSICFLAVRMLNNGYSVALCCSILKNQFPYLSSSSCLPHPGGMIVVGGEVRCHLQFWCFFLMYD